LKYKGHLRRFFVFFEFITPVFFAAWLTACNTVPPVNKNRKVYIDNTNGKYTLFRDGQPYMVKGAAGFTNLAALKAAGGNTIRTWDTLRLASILDEAQKNKLAVVVGLYLPNSYDLDYFYTDTAKVAAQLRLYKAVINRFKDHPALLCWCAGNELIFPFSAKYTAFYTAFNNLVAMIHHEDPNHPVTTISGNFSKRNVFNINTKTGVDFISFNVFGAINSFSKDLENFEWCWKGPFLITEWGIEGPWEETGKTAWGAFIENTSTKKAEQLLSVYRQYMPVDNKRFLGSLVFYWGQKQETTATWFSFFDESGAASESVNVMQYIWLGKKPAIRAPAIKYMLVNEKGARDNIMFAPGEPATARVLMETPASGLRFQWVLLPEDWYKTTYIINEKKMDTIEGLFTTAQDSIISFSAPAKEGPYRLFAYVYDSTGHYATCNTPVYVMSAEQ
jgi:Glycosyl hydrolases family 2, TIM barrel domain